MPNIKEFLADNTEDDDEYYDEYYDSNGNCSPNGLYDAGGHIVSEQWSNFADCIKYRLDDLD